MLIIDEINRGNMSKIFGELLMLIENSYRGKPVTLSSNGESFTVPENLYVIGMMNTADRSLAMIDYALRRRFSFIEMEPGFKTEGFKAYQKRLGNETFDKLIAVVDPAGAEAVLATDAVVEDQLGASLGSAVVLAIADGREPAEALAEVQRTHRPNGWARFRAFTR